MDIDGLKQQLEEWNRVQEDLQSKLIIVEDEDTSCQDLSLVGGVDISFPKDVEDRVHAVAAIVVISFPDLKVVYQNHTLVHLTSPYIPGYLAFREAKFLVDEVQTLRKNNPQFLPQVLLVDGNGILHPRGFGVACHVGVLADLATIGVAKQLFHVNGLEKNEHHCQKISTNLVNAGDSFPLIGQSNTVLGKALKSTKETTKPIYVSVGHKISLEKAVKVVTMCCAYRIPEPVRQADIISRKIMSDNYEMFLKDCETDWKGLSRGHKKVEELAQQLKLQSITECKEGLVN